MSRMLMPAIAAVALVVSTPALADVYNMADFSAGTFGGNANVKAPFSGNGYFPGQTFSGSFVFDNDLIPAAGSGFVNVLANSFPDAANIPASDQFVFNFGGLTFTAANAIAPMAIQYNNGKFNGFFYLANFAFQGAQYQLQIQGGSLSVVALDAQNNPTFNNLVNGYVNIGDASVTNITSYVPVTGPGGGGVPEPATWAMMMLGMFGIGGALRYRTAKVSFA
ncbi:MAG: PEPxxWA-CTERM sorting domain-containing protein [Sphingomonas sp.]|nr:PEPxxWA-CTERM sorting domain-containing protein [Sphingomonas sp.]